jgi:two-component system, cell cycle sensor histidine kinase and response regulator CckA
VPTDYPDDTMTANQPSVLIVEDEAIVAEDLRQTLTELDYDAFAVATSAEEAIACASERCPDIVLMDIRIKGARDGIDAAATLRERFDVPVVFLTAHSDRATFERASKTKPFAYLLKPIKTAELRSALEIALLRHQTERELRMRERWFSTTLRSIADAVVAVDSSGKVVFMNPSAEALTGMTEAAAVGRPAREVVRLLDPQSHELHETPIERALNTRTAQELPEGELCGADLARRTINDSTAPVIDDGELLGAVMVFRDITERKLLQQQLELADRLASIGTLAAGVAHEVNNPLTVVLGGAELVHGELERILTEVEQKNPQDQGLIARLRDTIQAQSEISFSAQRIARIVADLSGFARPAVRTGNCANVERSLAWAVRTTSHELNQRARVISDVADAPDVALDETRLGQVLVNLLVNAAHAIPEGAVERNTVTVSARVVAARARVVIEVRDTGCGMPASVCEHVFEPFFTTKPLGEGTVRVRASVCRCVTASCALQAERWRSRAQSVWEACSECRCRSLNLTCAQTFRMQLHLTCAVESSRSMMRGWCCKRSAAVSHHNMR